MPESTPLAPWIRDQCQQLASSPGQALLLQGPSGLGQYHLALALARSWLCESPTADALACGNCPSCHAVDVRTHADLCVLMPETYLLDLQWPLGERAMAEIDDKKRKPSREIRVDAVRDAIEFSQRTSGRGRGKVVLVFPAEDMNAITANALLKTLEEPPGRVRFVLATESAHQLLPTIRSRCLAHNMTWPMQDVALDWMVQQGIEPERARLMLLQSGGRPHDALQIATGNFAADSWAQFPAAMAAGNVALVRDWPVQVLLDSLHKLCHDALRMKVGGSARFFDAASLRGLPPTSLAALSDWGDSLSRARRTADHPFAAGLMQDALVDQAKSALHSPLPGRHPNTP